MKGQKPWCFGGYAMNAWIIPINVAVAAIIGGVTNHLAIKMLFHPREAKFLFGRKLPFTPGLIPKRRDEVAVALGKVVSEYLVTSEGLVKALDKADLKERLSGKLSGLMDEWLGGEHTVEELAARAVGAERMAEGREQLLQVSEELAERMLGHMWEAYRLDERTLADIVPGWSEELKHELVVKATDSLLGAIREELMSGSGELLIRRLTGRFLESAGGGGLLGALAGMFVDQDKMVVKVRGALDEALASEQVRGAVYGFAHRKLTELETEPLTVKLSEWLGIDVRAKLGEAVREAVKGGVWLDGLLGAQMRSVSEPFRDSLIRRIPDMVEGGVRIAARNMERLVAAVRLPELVEAEVQRFPIEKLERIVLDLSGKEFRAITWLGALLGGLIGLLQALFYFFYMQGG